MVPAAGPGCAFRVLFSPLATTQLYTYSSGKATSLDNSFPAIKDFLSTSTHTDGWSILDGSVRGGLAADFADVAFRVRVTGKCRPISLKQFLEEWPGRDTKQWIRWVVHDIFGLFFDVSKLEKPLKAERNVCHQPTLDSLAEMQSKLVGTTYLLKNQKKEGLSTRARKRVRHVSEQLQASCLVLWVDNFKELRS